MTPLTIGIDYDGTFTADPTSWSAMIRLFRGNGHRFFLVTARRETEENVVEINDMLDHWGCQMPIVFSSLGSKLYAVEKRGIKIDIWIDDDPDKLVRGH
jgi:hypothetical protein